MRLVSVNVGLPRDIVWRGKTVKTGIFKAPVNNRVTLRRLNLDGDRQADLAVHGGADKAVYAYPVEHYAYWRGELPGQELPFGMFGENFTIEGLLEDEAYVGNRLRIGKAELVVTQPRLPCYKLGIRFQADDMAKRFLASGRTGFYLSVVREGQVGAGDKLEMILGEGNSVRIPEITRLYVAKRYSGYDVEILQRAVRAEGLPEAWRTYLLRRLEKSES
ncbi:MAG TPA: MOSC domain-containing protein [Candidatus Acidoferrales bacterium]|nr:MOSC domain-containing protein [Candidatus Acidoferrales bacterium]